MIDFYAALGVPRDATRAEIRAAYKQRAKRAHPDAGGSTETFRALVRARDVLSDDARRERYDRTGDAEEAAPDNAEAQAMQCLAAAIDVAIQNAAQQGLEPAYVDLVARAKVALTRRVEQVRAQVKEMEKRAVASETLARRFRRLKKAGDGPNKLRNLLEGSARTTRQTAEFNLRAVKDMERALEILADYEFEADKAPATNLRDFMPSTFIFGVRG